MAERRIATCLWFERDALEAARLYCGLFPDSAIERVDTAPADYPGGKAGDVLTVNFTVLGQAFMGLNGKAQNGFTDAVSFQVFTDSQEETDRYWDALTADGGGGMACSWCYDRYGLRWQIVPRVLMDALGHPDAAVRARAFEAMQTMVKIDHAAISAAVAGEG